MKALRRDYEMASRGNIRRELLVVVVVGGKEGGDGDEMVMKSSVVSEEGGNVEGEEQEGEYDEVLRRDGERD